MGASLSELKQRAIGGAYRRIAKPLLFRVDPERVHDGVTRAAVGLGSFELTRRVVREALAYSHPRLRQTVAGVQFENPVGLSAGFDKDGRLVDVLGDVGFGFTQVGSVTLRPYGGNPPPRLHRLPDSEALVVYYGLKSEGAHAVLRRMRGRAPSLRVSISIAKTNDALGATLEGGIRDYRETLDLFRAASIADFFTLNVSCPNTFGGEPFTTPDRLDRLLAALELGRVAEPVFLKLPVDLEWGPFSKLLDVAVARGVRGVVIANLTKNRDSSAIRDPIPSGVKGGISGRPTQALADALIGRTFAEYGRSLTIIGVGGVFSSEDAYAKIRRGASLVQLITGMIYRGPQLIGEINRGLVEHLDRDGFATIADAVGADHR